MERGMLTLTRAPVLGANFDVRKGEGTNMIPSHIVFPSCSWLGIDLIMVFGIRLGIRSAGSLSGVRGEESEEQERPEESGFQDHFRAFAPIFNNQLQYSVLKRTSRTAGPPGAG